MKKLLKKVMKKTLAITVFSCTLPFCFAAILYCLLKGAILGAIDGFLSSCKKTKKFISDIFSVLLEMMECK